MKKLFFLFALVIGTSASSETVDISTLSDYEKKVHRITWCYVMAEAMLFSRVPDHGYQLSLDVYGLLGDNNFFVKDEEENRVIYRARSDLETEIILGKTFTKQETDACNSDAKAILKDEYVPNFSYMKNQSD